MPCGESDNFLLRLTFGIGTSASVHFAISFGTGGLKKGCIQSKGAGKKAPVEMEEPRVPSVGMGEGMAGAHCRAWQWGEGAVAAGSVFTSGLPLRQASAHPPGFG